MKAIAFLGITLVFVVFDNYVNAAFVGQNRNGQDILKESTHSRRFLFPTENDQLRDEKYADIVSKIIRLEHLESVLADELDKTNKIVSKIVNIAKYCYQLRSPDDSNLSRGKRDVSRVTKNETKVKGGERRALFEPTDEKSEIQVKLLNYIDDMFDDIENKMDALNATKENFATDDNYKIGYIMSNIDTLKVNLGNIQKEVDKNKNTWTDKRILEVYDTVIKSNKALTNLLNILNVLTRNRLHNPMES